MGAKLQLEAEAYLDRAGEILAAEGHPGVEFAEFATLATIRGERETAIRIMKKAISSVPDATLSTFGLVQHLTKVGRRAEAEIFLARLQDSNAVWGAAAELLMHAIAGELPAGSAELDAALNDDLPHIARGMACFDVGDIDRGIREWRQFEPAFLRQLWEFLPSMETYYSPGVVNDERYQTQLRNLGVGRPWRAYMRERVAELAPITGIPLTSPIAEEDVST